MIFVTKSSKLIAPLFQRGVRGDLRISGEIPVERLSGKPKNILLSPSGGGEDEGEGVRRGAHPPHPYPLPQWGERELRRALVGQPFDRPFPKGDGETNCKVPCTPRSRWGVSKIFWTLVLAALLFVGCRSTPPPTAFYTLTAVTKAETAGQSPVPKGDFAVGIGPVQIPEYLDRPQLVTRAAPDRVVLSEFNRWGGSLRQDFPRVLAENVAALLGTDRVLAYPWGDRLDPTYRVALDVQQFDGQLGETVALRVTWVVTGREGKTPLSVRKSDIREPVSGTDYDALVGAQSRAVAALSRQIAGEISKLAGGAGS